MSYTVGKLFYDARYLSKGLESLYFTGANIKRYTVLVLVPLPCTFLAIPLHRRWHAIGTHPKNLLRLWLAYTELQDDITCYNSYLLTDKNPAA